MLSSWLSGVGPRALGSVRANCVTKYFAPDARAAFSAGFFVVWYRVWRVEVFVFVSFFVLCSLAVWRKTRGRHECPYMENSTKTPRTVQHPGSPPAGNGAQSSVQLLEHARADSETVLKELGSQLDGLSESKPRLA